MRTKSRFVASQCHELDLKIGETIIGIERCSNYWSEAELTLLWVGATAAVFRVRERTLVRPEWTNKGESSTWNLSWRDWKKVILE